jgi:DNA-binding NarL/FixJ family response regulator
MNSEKHWRVLIAEDHAILRDGLRALLTASADLEVVGEADNGREAIRQIGILKPDLVMMDLTMPGTNGIDAIREVRRRYPEMKVLTLTVHKTEEYIRTALQAGTNGYVLKETTHAELLIAIRSVMAGKTYLSPGVSERVISGYLNGGAEDQPATSSDSLTQREREVLKLVAEGMPNKKIALYLSISIKTVEKHRANLMKKLNLHNASALTSYAIENGLMTR